jgi:hypothetical protein
MKYNFPNLVSITEPALTKFGPKWWFSLSSSAIAFKTCGKRSTSVILNAFLILIFPCVANSRVFWYKSTNCVGVWAGSSLTVSTLIELLNKRDCRRPARLSLREFSFSLLSSNVKSFVVRRRAANDLN